MNEFMKQHPFVFVSSCSFTTSQRRGFLHGCYDFARGLGLTPSGAQQHVRNARMLYGEKEPTSHDSSLENEFDDTGIIMATLAKKARVSVGEAKDNAPPVGPQSAPEVSESKKAEASNQKPTRSGRKSVTTPPRTPEHEDIAADASAPRAASSKPKPKKKRKRSQTDNGGRQDAADDPQENHNNVVPHSENIVEAADKKTAPGPDLTYQEEVEVEDAQPSKSGKKKKGKKRSSEGKTAKQMAAENGKESRPGKRAKKSEDSGECHLPVAAARDGEASSASDDDLENALSKSIPVSEMFSIFEGSPVKNGQARKGTTAKPELTKKTSGKSKKQKQKEEKEKRKSWLSQVREQAAATRDSTEDSGEYQHQDAHAVEERDGKDFSKQTPAQTSPSPESDTPKKGKERKKHRLSAGTDDIDEDEEADEGFERKSKLKKDRHKRKKSPDMIPEDWDRPEALLRQDHDRQDFFKSSDLSRVTAANEELSKPNVAESHSDSVDPTPSGKTKQLARAIKLAVHVPNRSKTEASEHPATVSYPQAEATPEETQTLGVSHAHLERT